MLSIHALRAADDLQRLSLLRLPGGSSMLASIFNLPWQRLQVPISTPNSRFTRCAQLMATWGGITGCSAPLLCVLSTLAAPSHTTRSRLMISRTVFLLSPSRWLISLLVCSTFTSKGTAWHTERSPCRRGSVFMPRRANRNRWSRSGITGQVRPEHSAWVCAESDICWLKLVIPSPG
jgi:hypothetical protein